MATGFTLLPPPPLEIRDGNVAEKFRLVWSNYALATEVNKKPEPVQVAVIVEDARDVYSTFDWADEAKKNKIESVLQHFANYCQSHKNIPLKRYRFNKQAQEAGESYDQYKTALRKLAEGCEFNTITPEEILCDRLIFGVRDAKVRERLLRESQLTLKKTDEICRASESTAAQMKEVSEGDTVNSVSFRNKFGRCPCGNKGDKGDTDESTKAYGNCGQIHDPNNCFACGKTCDNCGKHTGNHFSALCRSGKHQGSHATQSVKAGDIAAVMLDDEQLVTLRLSSENYLHIQPDTGAQWNIIPVQLYRKAANDPDLKEVKPSDSTISVYGGSQLPVIGQVTLRVCRDSFKCLLDCKLVDHKDIHPILG